MPEDLRAPFPAFGGKSRAAAFVWERFGTPVNYVEPFAFSAAVLLACPEAQRPRVETINDVNGFVSNFWRAVKSDPEAVASAADYPVIETDLHARHRWLLSRAAGLRERLEDPDYFDARIAAWWVWGASAWIGSGWCEEGAVQHMKRPHLIGSGDVAHPNHGKGIHAAGMRAREPSRQMPAVSTAGMGINAADKRTALYDVFARLSARLRYTRVACGDWSRICTPAVTYRHGLTAVFLDPPYEGHGHLYGAEEGVSAKVRAWALEMGQRTDMRIALCGYEGEHDMPATWECVSWKSEGRVRQPARGRRQRERATRADLLQPRVPPPRSRRRPD